MVLFCSLDSDKCIVVHLLHLLFISFGCCLVQLLLSMLYLKSNHWKIVCCYSKFSKLSSSSLHISNSSIPIVIFFHIIIYHQILRSVIPKEDISTLFPLVFFSCLLFVNLQYTISYNPN